MGRGRRLTSSSSTTLTAKRSRQCFASRSTTARSLVRGCCLSRWSTPTRDSTRLDTTRLDTTRLDKIRLDKVRHDSTRFDTTPEPAQPEPARGAPDPRTRPAPFERRGPGPARAADPSDRPERPPDRSDTLRRATRAERDPSRARPTTCCHARPLDRSAAARRRARSQAATPRLVPACPATSGAAREQREVDRRWWKACALAGGTDPANWSC
jgi:hypothetical protein